MARGRSVGLHSIDFRAEEPGFEAMIFSEVAAEVTTTVATTMVAASSATDDGCDDASGSSICATQAN